MPNKQVYRETDTETIQTPGGSWRNIEGQKSKRAGMPVTKYYPHEKTVYPTMEEAVSAAKQTQALNEALVKSGRAVYEKESDGIYEPWKNKPAEDVHNKLNSIVQDKNYK